MTNFQSVIKSRGKSVTLLGIAGLSEFDYVCGDSNLRDTEIFFGFYRFLVTGIILRAVQ